MKSGGEISAVEREVPNWGGGESVADIMMADGGMEQKEGKDVEWEVSYFTTHRCDVEASSISD